MDETEFKHLMETELPVTIQFGRFTKLLLDMDGFTVSPLLGSSRRYQWDTISELVLYGARKTPSVSSGMKKTLNLPFPDFRWY